MRHRKPRVVTPAVLLAAATVVARAVAGPADVQQAGQGEDKNPRAGAAVLEAVQRSVQQDPGPAADHGAEWAQALLRGEHPAEAAAAAEAVLTLPVRPGAKLDLLEVRGWGLIRSGKPDQGVSSLLAAVRQSPGYPGRAADWATRMPEAVYNDAAAAAEAGKPAWAADLIDLCAAGLLDHPQDTPRLQGLQRNRVRLLIACGQDRAAEALSQAKAYYEVAAMPDTAAAMLLVVQALQNADPSGASAERFKQEQADGAEAARALRATDVDALKVPPETTLHGIKVDGSAYDTVLKQHRVERYEALVGRGNLLLLADRPAEAFKEFRTAYTLADNNQVEGASANLARAYKAMDGTIGRANAFVLALRPKPPLIVELVSTAQSRPVDWKYTFDAPADGWQREKFDDSAWKQGPAPFGHNDGAVPADYVHPRTEWAGPEIYMRRTFTLPANTDTLVPTLRLMALHDEGAEVYINGVLAVELIRYNTTYEPFELTEGGRQALRPGVNTIALHCHNTFFSQVIDVGLATVEFRN